jgi:agmatine deiminase
MLYLEHRDRQKQFSLDDAIHPSAYHGIESRKNRGIRTMVKKSQVLLSIVIVILLVGVTGASAFAGTQTSDGFPSEQSVISFSIGSSDRSPIRQPAEFEPMQGALIRYSSGEGFGISYDIINEMAEDVNVVTIVASISEENTVLSQFSSHGIDLDHCSFLIAPTNSMWTRDYGPWFIFNQDNQQGIVDFTYNRPRPNDDAIPGMYAANQSIPLTFMNLEHTGGNYMTDGQGIAISTTLVWEENQGYTHEQINQMLEDYCGITTYHVVADVNGEYIKHVDCWGKYLSPDTIMIREVPPSHPQYDEIEAAVDYFESQPSCYGTPYHVVRVYTPNNEPYTNSLILNNKVLIPITGSQWDDDAILSYQQAMPGYEVLGFTGSWYSTDALHCRVMGITDRYMLYIEHTPLSGNQESETGYEISARIYPYSGENLIAGSTGVYWSIDHENWNFVQLQPLGDDYYHAVIPSQQNGTSVYYYIHAEDASGRAENHPYIGEAGAHVFTAIGEVPQNNAPAQPQRPSGQVDGKVGTMYLYSTQTTDADGDQVYYLWDWGDGNFSEWLGPFASGAGASTQHAWASKGTYLVRVKAKDVVGAESNWSEPLSISMPCGVSLIGFFQGRLSQWLSQVLLFFRELVQTLLK